MLPKPGDPDVIYLYLQPWGGWAFVTWSGRTGYNQHGGRETLPELIEYVESIPWARGKRREVAASAIDRLAELARSAEPERVPQESLFRRLLGLASEALRRLRQP